MSLETAESATPFPVNDNLQLRWSSARVTRNGEERASEAQMEDQNLCLWELASLRPSSNPGLPIPPQSAVPSPVLGEEPLPTPGNTTKTEHPPAPEAGGLTVVT